MGETDYSASLHRLMAGNERFLQAIADGPDPDGVLATLSQADPYAVVLGCSDSRVPPEVVFNESVGRLFVIRVASNVAGDSETGTVEYALARWDCPLVVVLGHTKCGGVAAAMDRVPDGAEVTHYLSGSMHLTSLLGRIRTNLGWSVPGHSTDPWADAIELNVRRTMQQLIAWSIPIRTRVQSGELVVAGAVYDVDTGEVKFLDQRQ